MSNLYLIRRCSSDFGTVGKLFVDSPDGKPVYLCRTLEPSKIDGEFHNALAVGSYPLSMTFSPKFRCNLPLISASGRDGIRIHAGNTVLDTTGCILVGLFWYKFQLHHSRVALKYVLDVIKVLKVDEITIQDSNVFTDVKFISDNYKN